MKSMTIREAHDVLRSGEFTLRQRAAIIKLLVELGVIVEVNK